MRTFFYAITVVDILIHYLFAVPNAVTSENSRHFEMKSKIVYILFRGFHYVPPEGAIPDKNFKCV